MSAEQIDQWYRITLSAQQRSFGFAEIIQAELAEIWLAAGLPPTITLWREECAELTCLYFSPGAARYAGGLFMRFGAKPCPAPALQSMTQLLGNPDDFDA